MGGKGRWGVGGEGGGGYHYTPNCSLVRKMLKHGSAMVWLSSSSRTLSLTLSVPIC